MGENSHSYIVFCDLLVPYNPLNSIMKLNLASVNERRVIGNKLCEHASSKQYLC